MRWSSSAPQRPLSALASLFRTTYAWWWPPTAAAGTEEYLRTTVEIVAVVVSAMAGVVLS